MAPIVERILARPMADNDGAEERRRREAVEFRNQQWGALVRGMGERYASCRLVNFELSPDEATKQRQQAALDRLRLLGTHMAEHIDAGGNVILYGPPGTGKDHLLMALLHLAIAKNLRVQWRNGQDLFGDFRDRIDTDRSEESSVRDFESPQVLAISDPVPPKGTVSDFSTTMLYRIIDRRYRQLRSTWITANIAKADEARTELSGPIFDRLMDNCVTVFCNWPSYRQQRKPEWLK